jgi:hypothetical protein
MQASSDCIFDTAFELAEEDLPEFLVNRPGNGEKVAAGAVRATARSSSLWRHIS